MTEAEWLESDNSKTMLEFLQGKVSDRKLRLFACANCHRIDTLLTDTRSRAAIEIAEKFAEGEVKKKELQNARSAAYRVLLSLTRKGNSAPLDFWAALAAESAAFVNPLEAAKSCRDRIHGAVESGKVRPPEEEDLEQVRLIHEFFPNPFRHIAINPQWLTSTVLAVATGIYQDRAFDRMAILADALQDAGCDKPDILYHCQQPSDHVRGCWVLDLVLSKDR